MGKVALGWPLYSDDQFPSVTPALSGGSYSASLPLSNLQDRKLSKPARSSDAELSSTRLHADLGTSRDVGLVVVPKHTLSKTGAYVRAMAPSTSLVFDYEAGYDIASSPWPGTDSRADGSTCATYIDRNGVVHTVAASVLRESHFISSTRHTLLELARTNICLRSQEFDNATWTKSNATVSANTDTAPDGTTTADRIVEDSTASAAHFAHQNITATSNATVTFSCFLKAGARTWARLNVREAATPGNAINCYFNLSTGAVGTASNDGTGTGAVGRVVAVGNGWYRCSVTGAVNNSATALNATVRVTTGDTVASHSGDGASYIIAWGGQFEDSASFPTSYIPTTSASVTRAVDILSFDIPSGLTTPTESTYYVKFVERGTSLIAGARVLQISESGSNASSLRIATGGGNQYAAFLADSGGTDTSSSTASGAPSFGDTVELRITVSSAGVVQIHQSLNGAAATSGTAGAAGGLPAGWGTGTAKIHVGQRGGTLAGAIALQSFRIMAGTQTLATMQASVHDSGWTDAWPSGLDAEEADGINVPWVYLPSSTVTARYWHLQIDDADNSAGSVDLSRLVIAGLYEPTTNMNLGARLGLETDTQDSRTDGGSAIYQEKPVRRYCNFYLDNMAEAEAFASPWMIQRRLGTSKQLYLIFNLDDSAAMLAERSFLGVLRELTALEFDKPLLHGMGFRVLEEI